MQTQKRTPLRVAENAYDAARMRTSQVCCLAGCGQPTYDRKSHCVDHLSQIPYVKALREELTRRENEIETARRGHLRMPDPSSAGAREIVAQLAFYGGLTLKRLGIEAHMPSRAVENYVRALKRAGLVDVLMLGSARGKLRCVVMPRARSA